MPPSPRTLGSQSDPSRMVGTTVAGRYVLEELVGIGGMASVFRAVDLELDRPVALKMLRPELVGESSHVDRFRLEARMAAALVHENIVSVIDRGEHDRVPFIVYEFVGGENLKQLVGRTGPLPVDRALVIAAAVARALAFAHANGYVHRDVKPQNILISARGVAKVTDFGIARSLTAEGQMTEVGTVLGSANYIAPEQAQGLPSVEASDIYSLGVVLFEMLTGQPPFLGEGFVAVATRHVSELPPRVRSLRPEVSPRLDRTVARALAKNPDARFGTMEAFADELNACQNETQSQDTSAATLPLAPYDAHPPVPTLWRHPHKLRAALIGLALATVAVAATLAAVFGQRGGPHPAAGSTLRPTIGAPVPLHAVAAYDPPPGDGVEDNARLALATDGNPATAWVTEWYTTPRFGNLKTGVGIVLDAARPQRLMTLTVRSDTPGFPAIIKAGPSPHGPFTTVSRPKTVERKTTFPISAPAAERYYLLWITGLPPTTGPNYRADINDVTARSPH
jgi:serine/threonine-protein kinase